MASPSDAITTTAFVLSPRPNQHCCCGGSIELWAYDNGGYTEPSIQPIDMQEGRLRRRLEEEVATLDSLPTPRKLVSKNELMTVYNKEGVLPTVTFYLGEKEIVTEKTNIPPVLRDAVNYASYEFMTRLKMFRKQQLVLLDGELRQDIDYFLPPLPVPRSSVQQQQQQQREKLLALSFYHDDCSSGGGGGDEEKKEEGQSASPSTDAGEEEAAVAVERWQIADRVRTLAAQTAYEDLWEAQQQQWRQDKEGMRCKHPQPKHCSQVRRGLDAAAVARRGRIRVRGPAREEDDADTDSSTATQTTECRPLSPLSSPSSSWASLSDCLSPSSNTAPPSPPPPPTATTTTISTTTTKEKSKEEAVRQKKKWEDIVAAVEDARADYVLPWRVEPRPPPLYAYNAAAAAAATAKTSPAPPTQVV